MPLRTRLMFCSTSARRGKPTRLRRKNHEEARKDDSDEILHAAEKMCYWLQARGGMLTVFLCPLFRIHAALPHYIPAQLRTFNLLPH
mmetsp:Transcript_14068/g.30556  ORF Transcript_14068/g.30556 Transcript_14068/m.30556 type:complete len:87 (+) Transcript_14068:598-858(+)